ncbi:MULTISPECIES: YoaK family protein [Fusobacterium]|uniref:YoaK family protein n=1 Tax=Fusobacterium TaxID=848 RepID=UPI001476FCA4|nr:MULTISPECIES: YoaK family protein [Fusobacterium]NME36840.1 DUF1275 domain-containing protein [Fusobacterium sp. FSA-380-WT-3A]
MENFKLDSFEIKEEGLECEKLWVFLTLMMISGFYGAFTYTIRGAVFCNAQTANFVLFAMELGSGHFSKAFYYLIPMSAYCFGAIISEAIGGPIKRLHNIRWDTVLIFIEIIVVIILGLLPESAPYQISQVFINFICSMQYNTFRKTRKIPMATTFCTNHLRQAGISIVNFRKFPEDENVKSKLFLHLKMIGIFVIGGLISTILCHIFLGKAILFTLIPLSILFVRLFLDDLKNRN